MENRLGHAGNGVHVHGTLDQRVRTSRSGSHWKGTESRHDGFSAGHAVLFCPRRVRLGQAGIARYFLACRLAGALNRRRTLFRSTSTRWPLLKSAFHALPLAAAWNRYRQIPRTRLWGIFLLANLVFDDRYSAHSHVDVAASLQTAEIDSSEHDQPLPEWAKRLTELQSLRSCKR